MTNTWRCRHILYILGAVSAGFPLKKKFGTDNWVKTIYFTKLCGSNCKTEPLYGLFWFLSTNYELYEYTNMGYKQRLAYCLLTVIFLKDRS
ncbi:MAG TPA: hypothetical protein DCX32_03450 [Candidatus Moranbacteria bacterium]|nr:MAG: hypothetical protein UW95_C0024G0013 [Parcubacteria group bacterium GW2011_GWC1_45_14]HAV11573.1 hypothetical protein [Candidatus Moranbacteria bacterium]